MLSEKSNNFVFKIFIIFPHHELKSYIGDENYPYPFTAFFHFVPIFQNPVPIPHLQAKLPRQFQTTVNSQFLNLPCIFCSVPKGPFLSSVYALFNAAGKELLK